MNKHGLNIVRTIDNREIVRKIAPTLAKSYGMEWEHIDRQSKQWIWERKMNPRARP